MNILTNKKMKTDKIKELIDNSDMNQMQKNIHNGFIHRAEVSENEYQAEKAFIETFEKKSFDIVLSNDEVKIYKVKHSSKEWDIKYPYRSIYLNQNKNWSRTNTVSPTFDTAFLVYLEYKYLNSNSKFSDFAMKMLGITINE